MLGKLMKYEWKATWKLLLAANLLTVVMTVLAMCMVNVVMDSSDYGMVDFVAVMVIFTYVLSMFAVYVGTAIFLIHRFYTSTYGDQGYLLHTLPVDTHHIIIAKMLVSAIWVGISLTLIYLSVFLLFASSEDIFFSMMEGMMDTIEFLTGEKITAFTMIMTLVASVFSVFARVLKIGACISLGQLSSNHKLMLSFAWYVGIYLVGSMFQGLYFMIRMAISDSSYVDIFSYSYNSQWEVSLISGIVSCVVFYVLTWYVMSRKLNLD